MAALRISQSSSLATDSSKAKTSAASIFEILNQKSKIDSSEDSGMTLDNVKGEIDLQHVSFKYPTRPDNQIFRDLSLTIHSGKKGECYTSSLKRIQTTKGIGSSARNSTIEKTRSQFHASQPICPRSVATMKNKKMTPDFVRDNQAIKRQKLGGKVRQIVNATPLSLPHKSMPGFIDGATNLCPLTAKEDRKVYVRQTATPFIPMAEMVKRFESRTREENATPVPWTNLSLTRPIKPEFQTANRVRTSSLNLRKR